KSFIPAYQPSVTYQLLAGEHLLGFRYQDLLTDEEGNDEVITSLPVLIRFEAKAGETYHVDFKKPVSYLEAKQLEAHFSLTLSASDQLVASSKPAPENLKDGGFLWRSSRVDDQQASKTQKRSALQRLKYWWETASKNERKIFMQWVSTQ
ncbi:MAG TPA: DUF2057 domain-containing protein, partial [Gammaproteobacteria bacterium]|nr:DUF2057 domain-containing protein [Gammaproteobacteria bacterium]